MIVCDAIRFAVMAFFAVAYCLHFLTLPMIYGGLSAALVLISTV